MLLMATILFSGCASITRGTKEVLFVDSQPMGAMVRLSNGMTGVTPTSFKLPRDSVLTVTIEKPGYKTAIVQVNHCTASSGAVGMAGNIVFGGIIGAGVAMSGATQDLISNPVYVILEPSAYCGEFASNFK